MLFKFFFQNNFKRIFGDEKEVTKGKGIITLFRKVGFQTFLVDVM
jgi:hypothetical protein